MIGTGTDITNLLRQNFDFKIDKQEQTVTNYLYDIPSQNSGWNEKKNPYFQKIFLLGCCGWI